MWKKSLKTLTFIHTDLDRLGDYMSVTGKFSHHSCHPHVQVLDWYMFLPSSVCLHHMSLYTTTSWPNCSNFHPLLTRDIRRARKRKNERKNDYLPKKLRNFHPLFTLDIKQNKQVAKLNMYWAGGQTTWTRLISNFGLVHVLDPRLRACATCHSTGRPAAPITPISIQTWHKTEGTTEQDNQLPQIPQLSFAF